MQIVPGLSADDLMDVCNEIYDAQPRQLDGDFTVTEFSKKTGKSWNLAAAFLNSLVEEGKLIKIERAILKNGKRGACYRANPDYEKET